MEDISLSKTTKLLNLSLEQVKILHRQGLLRVTKSVQNEPYFLATDVNRLRSRRNPSVSEEAAQVSSQIQHQMSRSLMFLRRAILATGSLLGVYGVLVIVLAISFIYLPVKTASWLGIIKSPTAIYLNSSFKSESALAADTATAEADTVVRTPSAFQKLMQTPGKGALGLVRTFSPSSYATISEVTILDPNDVLELDQNGNVIPVRPLTIPESSLLRVDTDELVANLNSEYLQGKRPGNSPGDIAIVGQVSPLGSDEASNPDPAISPIISGLTNTNLSGSAGITNANLATPALTINTSGLLSGGGTVTLGGSLTLTCPTCGTATSTFTPSSTDTLTNKSIDATNNTLTNIPNAALANSGLSVLAGTGLISGGAVSLGSSVTLALPAVGTAGSYGSALTIPVITTDAQGRVTGATNTAITGLTVANFGSTNISQWTNDPGFITASSTDTLSGKSISGSTNTLTNIANGSLANSGLTFAGNTGLGSIALGGTLSILGSGINNASYSGTTVTIAGVEADTLASVTGRGATTVTALTLSSVANAITAGALTATGGSINGTTIGASSPSTGVFTTVNGLTVAANGTNTLNIAAGKTLASNSSLTFTGTDGTVFTLPVATDTLIGRTSTDTLTGKTLAAGSNTISGLTNTNLSGSAGITNANLATSSLTTAGNSGSGSVSLGGGLTFVGSGISNIVASGSTLTVTSTEADTLTSVAARGAITALPLTLNGGVTTTTSTNLTLDSGTTGAVSLGTGANAKTITIGNTTGSTGLNFNSGTGNINFTVDGTASSGKVQIGNSGTATPDLLVLDNGTADPTGVNGGMYYNSSTGKFRCYQASAWTDCITANTSASNVFKAKPTDQAVTSSTTLTNDTHLTFPVASGETWAYNYELFITNNSSAQPDLKMAILGASGWTCSAQMSGLEAAGTTFPQIVTTDCDDVPTAMVNSAIGSDAGKGITVHIMGTITASSAGSVTLQFAQNTSSVNPITIKAGSLVEAFRTAGADVAEVYYSQEPLSPGTVVSIDPTLFAGVAKSSGSNGRTLLGVVSTKPGLIIGESNPASGVFPTFVALSGRVPVRVSAENGSIEPGDSLTSSIHPGVAMKATTESPTIGLALTGFNGPGEGSVLMFVRDNSPAISLEDAFVSKDEPFFKSVATAVTEVFKSTVNFFGKTIFHADTTFLARPAFNQDTVGQAVIRAGQNQVYVQFQTVSDSTPTVVASLVLPNHAATGQIPSYAVSNISTEGFTVQLAKPALSDLSVSWVAFSQLQNDNSASN